MKIAGFNWATGEVVVVQTSEVAKDAHKAFFNAVSWNTNPEHWGLAIGGDNADDDDLICEAAAFATTPSYKIGKD